MLKIQVVSAYMHFCTYLQFYKQLCAPPHTQLYAYICIQVYIYMHAVVTIMIISIFLNTRHSTEIAIFCPTFEIPMNTMTPCAILCIMCFRPACILQWISSFWSPGLGQLQCSPGWTAGQRLAVAALAALTRTQKACTGLFKLKPNESKNYINMILTWTVQTALNC